MYDSMPFQLFIMIKGFRYLSGRDGFGPFSFVELDGKKDIRSVKSA